MSKKKNKQHQEMKEKNQKNNSQGRDENLEDNQAEAEIVERQKQEYQDLWNRYLRLQAEFDNYRKRSLQEKAEFIKFANQGLISELIGILDNFELSIKYADQKNDFKLMHQGVDMIIKQLHTLLKSKGLEKIKTIGENFNPHQHDALEIIEDQDVEADTVVEELQPGYLLSGRILRPAKVKVAKPKEAKKEAEKQENKETKKEKEEQSKEEDKEVEE
ncbi:MAG: nucleotide exchange factor GrpE [Candidatus Omnitrophica bacterium]|nr:nucleotide exchange factor GrpE [Candidatus Omnitrophota bacterium]MCF7892475.1 nucleotide exchange factor GrpE [Candidatus Omnitrophota bacterium]MCF7897984.1 nucleotide exchange factor GrpE [Candidatus Omnitrophota bacterium]MCF7909743.1 nucleotide exchange factor GrpE [Candidatus Omnitrophota bacterium]